jgi:hypothetical protein
MTNNSVLYSSIHQLLYSVGPSQGKAFTYTSDNTNRTNAHEDIDASSDIRTYDPNVRAVKTVRASALVATVIVSVACCYTD